MELIDEGENFRIEIRHGVAWCRVWRRPDVSLVEGTRYAAVLMNSLRALLGDRDHDVPGIVFDVREAPPSSGPQTLALLGEVIATWSLAGKKVALLVGPEEQRTQLGALLRETANGAGLVTGDVEAAHGFAMRFP